MYFAPVLIKELNNRFVDVDRAADRVLIKNWEGFAIKP